MTTIDVATQAAAAPMTAEQAATQRRALTSDKAFAARYMAGDAGARAQLDRLHEVIGAADGAEQEPPQAATPAAQQGDQPDDEALTFEAPASPSDYQFPAMLAREAGLEVDVAFDMELKQAMHGAGVDTGMAQVLYMAAINAQTRGQDPVRDAGEYHRAEQALQSKWGADYAGNLAIAKAEARRLFAAMPPALTGGATFDDWIVTSGLGNDRVVAENLYLRGKARAQA